MLSNSRTLLSKNLSLTAPVRNKFISTVQFDCFGDLLAVDCKQTLEVMIFRGGPPDEGRVDLNACAGQFSCYNLKKQSLRFAGVGSEPSGPPAKKTAKALMKMENIEPKREYTEAERREEDKKIRYLRRLVDFSLALIAQSPMSVDEAQAVVRGVRQHAVSLFPGKEETFDLVYTPRFRRLIAEKFSLL